MYEKSGVRTKYHKPSVAFIRALHIAPATCTLLTLSLQSREGFIIGKPSAQPIDLSSKIRTIPTSAGVYLYKNAEGEVIYVGKAKNLRSRVSSYFHEGRWEDAKTGTLIREAVDVDHIVVANNKEALALESHLIKQKKPRFNILLRDDKTYPYVQLTLAERYPRVYVTRRLRKDGSAYYGPYFPANLAYRIVDLIHRHFFVPSCKVDLNRFHPCPCLHYYIKRCLGPCVQNLTQPEIYAEAVRNVKLFLEGRETDLVKSLRERMAEAFEAREFERAARYRDLISTVEQLQEKQRIASVEGDDADVFGYHFENQMLAVNLFHMRGGKVLDRREFFWDDLPEEDLPEQNLPQDVCHPERTEASLTSRTSEGPMHFVANAPEPQSASATKRGFHPGPFFSALLKQLYLGQPYIPRNIYVPDDFEDRSELEDVLSDQLSATNLRAARVQITVPQRGDKRELIDLAGNNAKQSYDQRFRVLKPNSRVRSIVRARRCKCDSPGPLLRFADAKSMGAKPKSRFQCLARLSREESSDGGSPQSKHPLVALQSQFRLQQSCSSFVNFSTAHPVPDTISRLSIEDLDSLIACRRSMDSSCR